MFTYIHQCQITFTCSVNYMSKFKVYYNWNCVYIDIVQWTMSHVWNCVAIKLFGVWQDIRYNLDTQNLLLIKRRF